jgi:hypothetical protein
MSAVSVNTQRRAITALKSVKPALTKLEWSGIFLNQLLHKHSTQKSIQIVRPRGPFLTSPLGANFDPRGEFCPLGVKFSVRPSIFLNSRECSSLGANEGVNIPTRGHISPLGARSEVKDGPQEGLHR